MPKGSRGRGSVALNVSMKNVIFIVALLLVWISTSCGRGNKSTLPDSFNSMSTPEKMDYLKERMGPDSLATFICDIAMGNVYGARIELQEAELYAYEHYNEEELVAFEVATKAYEDSLPLHDKVKFVKLIGLEDPDLYSYELGLAYVGLIREEKKDTKMVREELDAFKRECRYDPEFYKRFIKGFKLALKADRHRDLDDKIYVEFINYQDSIK